MEKIRDMLRSGRREVYTHPVKGNRYSIVFSFVLTSQYRECGAWGLFSGRMIRSRHAVSVPAGHNIGRELV